ncbi:hypothetical protein LWI29_000604 [Acer saccharum]|uniref:Uncharacterized protein n=1 Tax=Acer saccharum TaxID=4024 RepID=A0AA39SZ02_ACESA|nr:hypothetical protein LWI29_000604 [Acer saccharum]
MEARCRSSTIQVVSLYADGVQLPSKSLPSTSMPLSSPPCRCPITWGSQSPYLQWLFPLKRKQISEK